MSEGQQIRTMHDDLSVVRGRTKPRPTPPLPARRSPAGRPGKTTVPGLAVAPRPRLTAVRSLPLPPRPNLVHTPRRVAPAQAHGALQLPTRKRRWPLQVTLIVIGLGLATLVLGAGFALLIELM